MSENSFLTEGLDTAPAPAETAPSAPEGNVEQQIADQLAAKVAEGVQPDTKPEAPKVDAKWYDDLPDDLKADPNVVKYSSKEALAKAHVNAVKLLGTDKVPLPKDENDAEGWERYYKAGGRPDKAEDYAIERGIDAHRAAMDAQAAYVRERDERITRELGDQLPAYKANAIAVMKEYGDSDLVAYLNDSKLGDDPRFIKAFGRIGRELLGDNRVKTPERSQATDAGDAQAQLAKFRERNSKALYDNMHPGHKAAVAQLTELTERLYGTEPVR
jgi:hypothetical protein